ncbi:MAG: hypothetical protein R3A48_01025 [Polyangiales bacterium]
MSDLWLWYAWRWLIAFAFTEATEAPVYVRLLGVSWPRALAASAITHPVVWWVLANPRGPVPPAWRFVIAEGFAVLVEAWWFSRDTSWRRALAASALANATSVGLGLASRALFGLP